MSSYISASFEKDYLLTSDLVRVIVRNRDDGLVPPVPSATHYPTHPDTLRTFIVVKFISDFVGEEFTRVAALADLAALSVLPLTTFEDAATNFVVAGVVAGDILRVLVTPTEVWTSDEYPAATFDFEV